MAAKVNPRIYEPGRSISPLEAEARSHIPRGHWALRPWVRLPL